MLDLETSIFSFSNGVFYNIKDKFQAKPSYGGKSNAKVVYAKVTGYCCFRDAIKSDCKAN